MPPRAVVLYGDGFNTEAETIFALSKAGFSASTLHISDLLNNTSFANIDLLVVPGGFSFGDEIRSGKVLALKLKNKLLEDLNKFVDKGKFLLGICNGFQVLTSLGILPDYNLFGPHTAALIRNKNGKFSNHWVRMKVNPKAKSPFLSGLSTISAPVRHGEGRLVLADNIIPLLDEYACLRYEENFNGSFDSIAALSNKKGNILGLMPHPEAFVSTFQHPAWTEWQLDNKDGDENHKADGLTFFQNAYKALNQ